MIRFSTTPVAGAPIWSLVLARAARMSAVVVSVRSVSMSQSSFVPQPRQLEASPDAAVAGQHLVRARGACRTRRVLLGLVVVGPELLDGIEDLPGQLDLFLP